LGESGGAFTDWTGYGQDHVGAVVDEGLAHLTARVEVLEVAGEGTGLILRVPPEHLHVGAVLLVVVADAVDETVHEVGDGTRQLDTAVGGYDSGLTHAGGEISSQEGGVDGVEHGADDIRHLFFVGEVEDLEVLVRVGLRGGSGGIAEKEADCDDQVATFLDPRVDVGLVVRGGRRLEVVGVFGGETRLLSVEHTLPSGLVERAVVDTAGVGHLAGTDGLDLSGRLRVVGRLGGLGGCGRVGGGGGVRRRFGGLGRGRCSRGVGGTVVTTG